MGVRLIQDPDYGYLRIDPIPTVAEVERFYREEFYGRSRANYVNDSGLDNMREEAEFHLRTYADYFDVIRRGVERTGGNFSKLTVADIGCGFGYWLKYLRDHGIEGFGVEPVQEGIDHCSQLGLEGHCVPIESLATPPRSRRVSLVTMINVLEHLREPAAVLKALRSSWLEPGGYVFLKVPNEFNPFQVAANQQHHLKQWWVVPPQHINYFSRQSLIGLLDYCGYGEVDTMATFPLEMFLLMDDVYVGNPELGKQIHHKRVTFERNLDTNNLADFRRNWYRQLAQSGIGREMIVLAKANGGAGSAASPRNE